MPSKLRAKPTISAKAVLVTLSCMVLLHLGVLVFYTQSSRRAQHELNQDKVIEQMINIVELVGSTPLKQRHEILKNLYVPYIEATLDPQKKWQFVAEPGTLWRLKHKLKPFLGHIKLSYKLDKETWLNLDATVDNYGLGLQLGLIILELVVAGALIFSAWSVNRFTEPLMRFKEVAERLGVDAQTDVVIEYGPSIIKETADAMNKMQSRIKQLLDHRTKMLAAISHDLRTPITRLKLRAQYIEDKEQYNKTIKDLDEMETMISQILSYARSEYASEKLTRMELNSLILTIVDEYHELGHQIEYHADNPRVIILGRRLALKRAITNFIANAVKYAERITIEMKENNGAPIITIDDDGPGIPEDDLESIFEPFYRPDQARSSHTGGVGLGLSVAHDILLNHQATCKLSNRDNGGLRVTIHFRRKPPANLGKS